jgi:hypothetical protein
MVNYAGNPFDGPSTGGLILESKVHLDVDLESSKKNVLIYLVYWATHSMTNWVMEKHLKVAA